MLLTLVLVALALLVSFFLLRKQKSNTTLPDGIIKNLPSSLETSIPYYRDLNPEEKIRFETLITAFLSQVKIEGVGTDITDTDRLLVAASGVIPIFGFSDFRYRNLTNVILYPDTFDQDFQFEGAERSILGMVGSGYMNGQMVLSRTALQKGFSASAGKENVGIHEFVHLIDKSDGATDGTPELLLKHEYAAPWLKMIHQEMQKIEKGKSDINPYAITNEAEFFAVASEYFFEKPEQFKHKHPELYAQMSDMFMQDNASKGM
ncbi:M90 family metallopeptidase [Pedobacter duraquae]|uniref:Zinc-dependent peptidase n=1 Tax=Pedobacter duraquae TaxID=425511 RepID=A0A4R6ILY6_9SPHI|nr:M90 family metallopeptidase [Pedobacter duraquae]TDO23174.1 hypothetical protein CLV32_2161 [Pedobacter duraquae]